jgi:predicted secreted protein
MDTLNLKPGESHIVTLRGLGSAGYRWRLKSSDPRIAAVEEVLLTKGEGTVPIAGSVDQQFRLTAIAPGNMLLRFELRRQFGQSGEPHASHEINVSVT